MAGGLLQLASEGIEDIYLTNNPEITYFSKIYRRHTNFASEIKKIPLDQSFNFNDTISITIEKLGDLLGKCFIEVEIPNLNLSDKIIRDETFIQIKKNEIQNLLNEIDTLKIRYENYKKFYEVEINFFRFMKKILKTENITNQNLKDDITSYMERIPNRENLVLALDNKIENQVNLFEKIISEINENKSIDYIRNNINQKILLLDLYLKKYFKEMKDKEEKHSKISRGLIEYCWDKYLGLNLFESYEVEIDGNIIERYDKDTLFIHLQHNYSNNMLTYIDKMIGNIKSLQMMDSNKKKTKLYIPLIFWFCKESINYLPLVSFRYCEVILRLKVNKLENILFFQNIESKFNKLKLLDLNGTTNLTNLSNNNSFKKIKYNKFTDIYKAEMEKITRQTIKHLFPEINNDDLENIFSFSSNNIHLSLTDLGKMRREMTSKNLLYKIFGKEPFIEYNVLYSHLKYLNVNLLAEFIYLDDVEREKFAINKLEYLIDTYKINKFNIDNQMLFDGEIDFTNPVKYIYFYFKPNGTNYGLHKFDIKKNNNYKIDNKGIINFNILVGGSEMFHNNGFNDIYFQDVTPYQYFVNSLPEGVCSKCFCLYPLKSQPSGSVNFSYLKGKNIKIEFSRKFMDNYFNINENINLEPLELNIVGKNYNILSIHKGKCRIIFSS